MIYGLFRKLCLLKILVFLHFNQRRRASDPPAVVNVKLCIIADFSRIGYVVVDLFQASAGDHGSKNN